MSGRPLQEKFRTSSSPTVLRSTRRTTASLSQKLIGLSCCPRTAPRCPKVSMHTRSTTALGRIQRRIRSSVPQWSQPSTQFSRATTQQFSPTDRPALARHSACSALTRILVLRHGPLTRSSKALKPRRQEEVMMTAQMTKRRRRNNTGH